MRRSIWFHGEQLVLNMQWVVALLVEKTGVDVIPANYVLRVKTLEGGYWTLAEGTKTEMIDLMNQLIK